MSVIDSTNRTIKKPRLRFSTFHEDWNTKIFESFLTEINIIPKDKYPLYSLTIESGVTPKSERYERSFLVTSQDEAYKLVEENDFVYNPMNLRFGAIGRHKEKKKVVVSKYYNIFRVANDMDPVYLEYYFKCDQMIHFYNRMAEGSLLEKKRVHYTDFIKFEKNCPTLPEQNKISQFISTIDNWIGNLQTQKQSLENYKESMMHLIFNQKFRFKDDDGKEYPKWESKKLGEVFDERNEKNGNKNLDLLSIKIKGGISKHNDGTNKNDTSSEDKSNYKIVYVGDIAYNTMRMWQGASGVSIYLGIVNPAYTVVSLKEGDVNFYGYLFKLPRTIFDFYRYSQGMTSDTWNLKYDHFSEVKVTVPSDKREQQKIAELLISIDNLLTSIENKLSYALQWKRGITQKIFI